MVTLLEGFAVNTKEQDCCLDRVIYTLQGVTQGTVVSQAASESKTQDKQVLRDRLAAGSAHHCATALHKDDAKAQSQTTWLQSRLREVSSSFQDC